MANKNYNKFNSLWILPWNIIGIRAKQEEMQAILYNQSISIACIQETLLENKLWNPPRNYAIEKSPYIAGEGNRGVAVLLHRAVPYTRLNINTTLEAVAVTIHLRRSYTVCSIYMSPNLVIRKEDLLNLLTQLPAPFLILGVLMENILLRIRKTPQTREEKCWKSCFWKISRDFIVTKPQPTIMSRQDHSQP